MRKKAIINKENKVNKCFLCSINLRYLHPIEKHKTRLTDIRKYENDLNFKGIDFPVKLKDIPKFEDQNPNIPLLFNKQLFQIGKITNHFRYK